MIEDLFWEDATSNSGVSGIAHMRTTHFEEGGLKERRTGVVTQNDDTIHVF